MKANNKQLELANEAKDLILEFLKEENSVYDNNLQNITVEVNTDGSVISIAEDEEKLDYNIVDISMSLSGFYNENELFHTFIELAKKETDENYKNMSKNAFIHTMGNLHYVERRCEEIFEKLEKIEDEAWKWELDSNKQEYFYGL